jgi:hypothetical protein
MSLEAELFALLGPLAAGRCYPDVLPDSPEFPCISYQQVGGRSLWFRERQMPRHKHARIQINVHAARRLDANALARAVEGALCTSTLNVEPLGAFVNTYEDLLRLYSTRQDFGIWYPDP